MLVHVVVVGTAQTATCIMSCEAALCFVLHSFSLSLSVLHAVDVWTQQSVSHLLDG